jgi:predicted RNA methylase
MARLASNEKMGYYPTPSLSLEHIQRFFTGVDKLLYVLDPCCGEGYAVSNVLPYSADMWVTAYGVELDPERASVAERNIGTGKVLQGSIFDAQIRPLGCFGLLYLNPPYDSEDGERVEIKFLKHANRWLAPKGVLVFIVPEHIFEKPDHREWIGQHFRSIRVYRLHRDDFPTFNQVVMFGYKRPSRSEVGEVIPPPPYQHIEDVTPFLTDRDRYTIPDTDGPTELFQMKESVTEEDIAGYKPKLLAELDKIRGKAESLTQLSPLLPLRKGHLVTLLTAGALDGRIDTPDGFLLVKGFSERVRYTREEDDKEITTDTYNVCVRVIDATGEKPRWFDIR